MIGIISSSVTICVVSSNEDTVVSVLVHSNAPSVIPRATVSPISTNRSFLFSKLAFSDFFISISVNSFTITFCPVKLEIIIFISNFLYIL